MMRFDKAIAFLSLVSFALASCQHVPDLVLFNNTGMPIKVRVGWEEFIAPGRSTRFRYPGGETNWTVLISAGGCDYLYQAPRSPEDYPWPIDYKTDPTAQVEPDFSIWAVPPDTGGIADVSRVKAQQKDGFPLHPVARECR